MLRNRISCFTAFLILFCLNSCSQYKPREQNVSFNVKHYQLKNFFGINAFEWDFEDPANSMIPDSTRLSMIESFSGVRHYMDWEKIEPTEGIFTFSPVRSGGWNYDTIYHWCKTNGIEVLACLKGCPNWMQDSYPKDERDAENAPARYGKDLSNPASYIEQAKAAFQYAARYGSNKNIDQHLLHVDTLPRWTADPINKIRTGLGLIKYIECDNERDKWWKGKKAFQSGREYAANLSAFYDGNKNKMGPRVGVKNADPNMKVVMSGLAKASPEYVTEMIAWCREHRGLKPDGTVDLPWDIINYHFYCNDADPSGEHQTSGIAPEVSSAEKIATEFIGMSHQYAADMPVWITETGYDINQESVQKAIPIGNKTALETQGDWILRTSLLYARCGIQKVFFYELYDDNLANGIKYASSGLINHIKTRRPAAEYLRQTNQLFGNYTFSAEINSNPIVDKYLSDDSTMYMLVLPTQKGRDVTYSLDLGNADTAYIYQPQPGSSNMSIIKKKTLNGKIAITVTETPEFVNTYDCEHPTNK